MPGVSPVRHLLYSWAMSLGVGHRDTSHLVDPRAGGEKRKELSCLQLMARHVFFGVPFRDTAITFATHRSYSRPPQHPPPPPYRPGVSPCHRIPLLFGARGSAYRSKRLLLIARTLWAPPIALLTPLVCVLLCVWRVCFCLIRTRWTAAQLAKLGTRTSGRDTGQQTRRPVRGFLCYVGKGVTRAVRVSGVG